MLVLKVYFLKRMKWTYCGCGCVFFFIIPIRANQFLEKNIFYVNLRLYFVFILAMKWTLREVFKTTYVI